MERVAQLSTDGNTNDLKMYSPYADAVRRADVGSPSVSTCVVVLCHSRLGCFHT